ncbi:granzyme A-like isoform 1-T1 [Trichechus inunguis]
MWITEAMKFSFPFSFPAALLLLLILGAFSEPDDRIIGEHEVAPHARRYMALLKGKNICAGALIKENWVLTAARCELDGKSQIILGANSISHKENHTQIFSVKRKILCPCYGSQTLEGDLQLLQLDGRATITKDVEILRLPKTGKDVKPHTKCHVAGWRSTKKHPKEILDTLREVNVTVIDRKICNNEKHYNFKSFIDKSSICAISTKSKACSYEVNSGSPLICDNIFRGVTSFGKCGNLQNPDIFMLFTKKNLKCIRKTIRGPM